MTERGKLIEPSDFLFEGLMVLRITLLLYTIACIISVSDEDMQRKSPLSAKPYNRPHTTWKKKKNDDIEVTCPLNLQFDPCPKTHFCISPKPCHCIYSDEQTTNNTLYTKDYHHANDSYNMSNTIWLMVMPTRSLSTWLRLMYKLFYDASSIFLPICGSALVQLVTKRSPNS